MLLNVTEEIAAELFSIGIGLSIFCIGLFRLRVVYCHSLIMIMVQVCPWRHIAAVFLEEMDRVCVFDWIGVISLWRRCGRVSRGVLDSFPLPEIKIQCTLSGIVVIHQGDLRYLVCVIVRCPSNRVIVKLLFIVLHVVAIFVRGIYFGRNWNGRLESQLFLRNFDSPGLLLAHLCIFSWYRL